KRESAFLNIGNPGGHHQARPLRTQFLPKHRQDDFLDSRHFFSHESILYLRNPAAAERMYKPGMYSPVQLWKCPNSIATALLKRGSPGSSRETIASLS